MAEFLDTELAKKLYAIHYRNEPLMDFLQHAGSDALRYCVGFNQDQALPRTVGEKIHDAFRMASNAEELAKDRGEQFYMNFALETEAQKLLVERIAEELVALVRDRQANTPELAVSNPAGENAIVLRRSELGESSARRLAQAIMESGQAWEIIRYAKEHDIHTRTLDLIELRSQGGRKGWDCNYSPELAKLCADQNIWPDLGSRSKDNKRFSGGTDSFDVIPFRDNIAQLSEMIGQLASDPAALLKKAKAEALASGDYLPEQVELMNLDNVTAGIKIDDPAGLKSALDRAVTLIDLHFKQAPQGRLAAGR